MYYLALLPLCIRKRCENENEVECGLPGTNQRFLTNELGREFWRRKSMKVTKSAGYALHALMYMVRHSTQLPVTAVMVAKAEGIPSYYLAKLCQKLARAGVVQVLRACRRS